MQHFVCLDRLHEPPTGFHTDTISFFIFLSLFFPLESFQMLLSKTRQLNTAIEYSPRMVIVPAVQFGPTSEKK